MDKGFFGLFADKEEEKKLQLQDRLEKSGAVKPVFQAKSIQEAANYLADIKAKAEAGQLSPKEDKDGITTATEPERIEYLNYCIQLIPERYAKHKILLFLLVNPWTKDKNGDGRYLSKRQVALFLTKECGFHVQERDVTQIEKEGLEMCKQAITTTRESFIPLVGAR